MKKLVLGLAAVAAFTGSALAADLPARTYTKAPPMVAAVSSTDLLDVARGAGLRYVNDRSPGIRRLKSGKGMRYLDADGRSVRDPATLSRIKALAIPPAWTKVWISPRPDGHIQAIGFDDLKPVALRPTVIHAQ